MSGVLLAVVGCGKTQVHGVSPLVYSVRGLKTYRGLRKDAKPSEPIKGIPYKNLSIGVPKEIWQNERRVALTPAVVATLAKKGFSVNVENGAGIEAKFRDEDFASAGAKVLDKKEYEFRVYSWNVRSVKRESTRLVMPMKMNRYQADVLCLSETRLNGVSEETIPVRDSHNSYLFLNSFAQDGSGDHGVGFVIGIRVQKVLLAWDPANPRIARLRLEGRLSNIYIIDIVTLT
ncbi:hypothetical protein QYM36_003353 [Artemia franciscana]|uniref:proton-translocating NAD(P)(+) transhydrogenase n=1 Tax=Artemia franciscana TaxID=6661 RepID=A0AA88I3S5_ARTSF|nr:hypothetical protein QYM36_003353 [Artemia franciscana]